MNNVHQTLCLQVHVHGGSGILAGISGKKEFMAYVE